MTSGQLKVDAQIGLVGAVALHGLADTECGGTAPRRPTLYLPYLAKIGRQHILKDGEDVVLRSEGHLHIQLIELAGAAVGTGVLIAEARRDLEIAVEAGGHEQLLELLRSLRQGIELAGMLAGRERDSRARPRARRLVRIGVVISRKPCSVMAAAQGRHDVRSAG